MEDTAEHFYALSAGTRLDEYAIVSIIGQGSFGITYLAEDVNLGLRFAVKEYLPGDWAVRDSTKTVRPKSSSARKSFEWGMDAFLKEARILASIAHPNIVKVRRFFHANGTAYIVMEFIEGRGFGDILARDYASGGFPNAALNALLLSLLDGLGAVHRAGIVHRDIKPGNILIEADGNPILIDFGAARNYQRTLAGGMTVIMTPGYAPIEQYAEDEDQGPFTDMYSLGAVAYRAITGQAPMEPYKRLSGGAFVTAAAAGAGRYAAPLLAAIDWAISIQPKDRPQSAADLRAVLLGDNEATKVLPAASARPADPIGAKSEGSRSNGKDGSLTSAAQPADLRRKLMPIALAAVLVVAALVGFAFYRSSGPTTATEAGREQADLKAAEAAREEADHQAAATKLEAERQAAEAAKAAADRQAAEAAKLEADRQAADAARQEVDRQAAAAAKLEADRQAAEAARQETDRQAADAARQEAARQAAVTAQQEADRKAAEAAKQEAARKAAEAAKQKAAEAAKLEAQRKAALAAQQEAARKANLLDGRWYADLPRNFCGGARVQAMVMGSVIFGSVGLPASTRAFRASIAPDGSFSSIGQFDRIAGKFADNALNVTVINSCSSWAGTMGREPFGRDTASQQEITAAFAGKSALFANGEATYANDGAYSFVDRSGPVKGNYVISDGAICVTFSSGVIRCDAVLKDGASFVLLSNQGYRFPVTFK